MSNELQEPDDSHRKDRVGEAAYPFFKYESTEEERQRDAEIHARVIEQLQKHTKGRTRSRWRPVD